MMMTTGHAFGMRGCRQRLANAVRGRSCDRRRQRSKQPREQDQQQEFGGPAAHIFQKTEEGSVAAEPLFPTSVMARNAREAAA